VSTIPHRVILYFAGQSLSSASAVLIACRPVFEMICRNVAVMRRRSDAYLNATQILKVAGFDKPQRTRVLEREVQKGEHEKVQGGYGKYQGECGATILWFGWLACWVSPRDFSLPYQGGRVLPGCD
jgi:hypothetical protein